MRPLLLILNPRRIDECVASFEELEVEKAWLTGFSEPQLVTEIAALGEATPEFTHYLLASDDLVVNQLALDAVLATLAAGHPVVTGYCNFDLTDDQRVGLSVAPLARETPGFDAYTFPTQAYVDAHAGELVRTWFAGWVLTGMSREILERFPFACGPLGAQTDYSFSWRLQQAGIPIVAPKAARVFHVKEIHGYLDDEPRKRLLIGEVTPEVRLELRQPAAVA